MKSLFEQIGGTYHEERGYFIPDLTARRRKACRDKGAAALAVYQRVLTSVLCQSADKRQIKRHFADINEQAEAFFFQLVKQFADKEGITEELKGTDQMAWMAQ